MKKFNVLTWNFNTDRLEYYDIIPYFVNRYNERVKNSKKKSVKTDMEKYPEYKARFGVPETIDEIKKFIEDESMYMFWSRCEWEMIIHGWPVQSYEHKIDVHEQIMMNIDVIADIVYGEVKTCDDVEQYIKDYTKRCSNEIDGEPKSYHPWLTPDHARSIVEIMRNKKDNKTVKLLAALINKENSDE